jgi:hypothetical protein
MTRHPVRRILMRQRIHLSNAMRSHMVEFRIVSPSTAKASTDC